jgi:ribokinase
MTCTLVAGSINMDVVNRVRVHPKPGETVPGLGLSYDPGGKGANQAVAVARNGGTVRMLAAVGDDTFSTTLLSHLATEGIDTSWIERVSGPAGMAFITVDGHGENTIIVEGGANAQLSVAHVDAAVRAGVLDGVGTLVVQNEVPSTVTLHVMQVAKKAGAWVVFNPAPVTGVTLKWLRDVDIVVVNETEAEALSGVSYADAQDVLDWVARVIQVFLDAGAQSAVVTLGGQGSVYGTRVSQWAEGVSDRSVRVGQETFKRNGLCLVRQPAFSVPVVDTTAAGDTFVGALTAEHSRTGDIAWSLQYASAAAALAVTKSGAQTSVPTKEEVLAFLDTRCKSQ